MKRGSALALAFFILCHAPVWAGTPLGDGESSVVEKIINPLPDFDPFVNVPAPPQFFPDEVEKRARQVLIDSLTERDTALEGHARFFEQKDAEMLRGRGTVTGLADHAKDLYHSTIRDRRTYLKAQKEALESASSAQQKNVIEARIRNDDVVRAEELLRRSATNRMGAVVNRLLSSADLVSLLSGSYLGAAIDSAIPQLLSMGSTQMSIEERKALTLYLRHLKRRPNDPGREEILKRIEALSEKKKQLLVERYLEEAGKALNEGELTRAELNYEMAALVDPTSPEVEEGAGRVRERMRTEREKREKGSRAPEEASDTAVDPAARGLLYALALRDPDQIEAEAAALEEKHRGTPLGESAREAASVAMEIRGRHDDAKKLLRRLADSSPSPRTRQRAEALLRSPDYNLLVPFREAQSQRQRRAIKYVLLGENFLERNLLLGASPIIAHGVTGATTYGAANLLLVGTNLFEVLTSNRISRQPIIDKGIAHVRSHPESESAADVYAVLADAYEKAGRYDKAIAYARMSGTASEEDMAGLKDRAAKSLLQTAEKSKGRNMKELYLRAILQHYPESAVSKEATAKLAHLVKSKNQGLRVSKEFLMENPELYGPAGLGLKPSLFDGDINNMELADKGVNLRNSREVRLHFQTPWGVQSRTYPLDRETLQRFELALRERHYEVALEDVHRRPEGSPGGIEDFPPRLHALTQDEGTSESKGVDLRLVKKAKGPRSEFPKVLDHQLLSEKERDPDKGFKLPPIHGSVSANRFDISGQLPTGLWGDSVMVGTDSKSPFAGVRLPIPLLGDFVPVDFLLQGRPGRPSLTPQIHRFGEEVGDSYLYR